MKKILTLALMSLFLQSVDAQTGFLFFPENGAKNINPDTHLTITFQETPTLTAKGIIRIYDAQTNKMVDQLDMSIPAGPTKPDMVRKQQAVYTPVPYTYETTNFTNANTVPGSPSGAAVRDTSNYQLTIIGRFTDGFHFHPVIVKGNTAVIYPHNNLLEYGKEYYVTIDKEVFTTATGDFQGVPPQTWKFDTKTKVIEKNIRHLVVSNDGMGDFNTVQGAMDFIPDFSAEKWEVLIKNGDYEELVYFRNKCNVTIKGESRDGVVVHYGNNETFNPHPVNIKTNEWPGTFPSRRGAFTADNCYDMRFENFTVMTTLVGQAEGLLLMGARNYLKNVHVIGSGDALQINGSVYLDECVIDGGGDTVLGRGPAFFNNCTLTSYGPFAWIRNTDANHGDVFVNCTFLGKTSGQGAGLGTVFARAPLNNGVGYPYAEAVLINCRMDNISPEGWGQISNATNHFWEYNSRSVAGHPVDVSHRHPLSRQLDSEKDAKLIKDYSNAEFVLGWNPFAEKSIAGQAPYTLENAYTMPLDEVFNAIEKQYKVKLVYPANLVEGKKVSYGLFRFKSDFLETLNIILTLHDLDYTINPDGSYKIKAFEYTRRRPEEGLERLNVLRTKYNTLDEWEARKQELKTCLFHTMGLAPLVDHLKLTYIATPKRYMKDYTVESFAIETLPGVYATGSVYRPLKSKGKLPFILNPLGHFADGRYNKDIQTHCAMLARMGAIVVDVDLFGMGESLFAFNPIDHRNSMAMTMQALNNRAILDYFLSQSDIDLERVVVTGASGGGSQSMTLTAIDDRIKISVPVVMVSAYFTGGCGCESGLPISWCGEGSNLAEFAAMAAPRPMLIVSDGGDWTAHVEKNEYPFIQRTYEFYQAKNKVSNVHLPDETHDFGPSKRYAVYDYLSNILSLNAATGKDKSGHWDESKVVIENSAQINVFGPNGERFPANAVKGINNLYQLVASLNY